MECSMSSAAVVKTAIEICNNYELKKEILRAPGSEYDKREGYYETGRKILWNEIVKRKAEVILQNLGLADELQEKIIGIVFLIGIRMLTWAEYHEGTLGLSREYSVNFLNSSYFTQEGIIDNKKAAEELIKDDILSIKHKYKLACIYCFADHISALHRQMTAEDRAEFFDAERPQRIKQPNLVKFWSYYLMCEIDKLKGEKNLYQYRLETSVQSGSRSAVEYCLEETNLRSKEDSTVVAAVEAVMCTITGGPHARNDRIVFRNQRYKDSEESWIPSDYYLDILCFLLTKMREDQLMEFLKDIEGNKCKTESHPVQSCHSKVLENLLNWPHQDCFMKNAKVMWDFLPKEDYAVLLLLICDKIRPRNEVSLKYGEERSYDYRELLKEFWCQSPDIYKRFVFSNEKVECATDEDEQVDVISSSIGLLTKLLTLQNFSNEDGENIKLILSSATGEEKDNILFSKEWREICIEWMETENWETLNRFVLNCFSSKEDESKFKRKLSFTNEVLSLFKSFTFHGKWNEAESLITCMSSHEEEINGLKKEMMYSKKLKRACVNVLTSYNKVNKVNKVKTVDELIKWCFPSEEEVKSFKKALAFSFDGLLSCLTFSKSGTEDSSDEFIDFCLSSEEDVRDLKREVAYVYGSSLCKELISDFDEDIYNEHHHVIDRFRFNGGAWEAVERFLTWCFSTEEEIIDFKKNTLLKEVGKEIHFNLIECNQWEEAERFFAWIGLSVQEVKALKKETLDYAAIEKFCDLMKSEEDSNDFFHYGRKQEAIELLSRWYLTDKESVIEFKNAFRSKYEEIYRKDGKIFRKLGSILEQRLSDLKNEKYENLYYEKYKYKSKAKI